MNFRYKSNISDCEAVGTDVKVKVQTGSSSDWYGEAESSTGQGDGRYCIKS